ncbi:SEC-C metal-binding domain-containing protein [Pseudomonas nitroreducens]|uniref:SEC-C metal-binding domain-containing protein n=1 Tax=Pseudomonas nitroreducens TaxID=46680 RepID=UPI001F46ABE9|nr:SEC-C metal-binding domain-containing protein [Pseudomonas nitroreducens]MCF6753097.1 SEC-C domain-containing protein [Stutzerimonas stutzeri]MDH1073350.1 SEC-C metal-binding domain-containing protein [Pseudomonas nitroreducens]
MQSNDHKHPDAVLDPAQLKRIESVHKGFLYQHLYAVGCLFLAQSSGVNEVLVERDEDVELNTDSGRIYVQVKTRSRPFMPGDTAGALGRFELIRQEHGPGRRAGKPQFVIVANQPLGETLQTEVDENKTASDLIYLHPESKASRPGCLPPAWATVEEAAQWCVAQAEKLNFSLLSPSALTWKMAGLVMLASAAGNGNSRHVFRTSELPGLFEQLIVQLQDFPTPPASYRPQQNEPTLASEERVRIICGLSGSGKTTWAAHAALHSPEPCAYYDVGDLPGPAIASSIVRELASKYSKRDPEGIRKILLPGASGYEAVRAFDRFMEQAEAPLVVVVDNAHRIPVANLRDLLNATRHIRFILLCQPHENVRELEAVMTLRRETLLGWDLDTVARVASDAGAFGSAQTFEQLRIYSGGLPLYVDSAIAVSMSEYGGDIEALCADLGQQSNVVETAQEVILARVYDGYDQVTQNVLAIVSLADTGLTNEEVVRLLSATLKLSQGGAAAAIKKILATGTVEVFGAKTLKVHDAVRALGLRHLELMGEPVISTALVTLKELLIESLEKNRDTSRFSLLTRVFIRLNDVMTLIGLAGEELFYEMGISVDITSSLKRALEAGDLNPHQAFWALDGLVFSHMREGRFAEVADSLLTMEQLLNEHGFEFREQVAWAMRKILFASDQGREDEVRQAVAYATPKIPDADHQRVFDYNHAIALWKLKRHKQAEALCKKVADEYFEILGLTPKEVMGKNPDALWKVIKRPPDVHEHIKHLADALEVYAKAREDQGLPAPFQRIHAMKFFQMVGGYESVVRVGQDLADVFVGIKDFEGAKEVMEQHVLPVVAQAGLMARMVQVRSQYAVILAWCGDYRGAIAELRRLDPYLEGLEEDQRLEVEGQTALIASIISEARRVADRQTMGGVARNERCPCGSGLKFKKCHGA